MNRVPLPDVLDSMARAGAQGIARCDLDTLRTEAIERVRVAGFPVRYGPERVYLDDDRDCLVGEWIRRDSVCAGIPEPRVHGFLEVDSTNTIGLECCREGSPHWTLVHAECQHAGRGRLGRAWSSPARVGLYFSVVLRPAREARSWPLLSLACGWAVAAAIDGLAPKKETPAERPVQLKWPNDVFMSGRKTAGILLENFAAAGSPACAVAGIGVNVRPGAVPPGLEATATSLEQQRITVPRRKLLVAVMQRVHEGFELFERGDDDELLDRWQECSGMHKDCRIWVIKDGRPQAAVTLGLQRSGGLTVRYGDDAVETLLAGEVSIRQRDELP